MQALPAAATQAREYYRNDKKYLDEGWAVMTVALRDVLTDDVLTEQAETHIAKLASSLGIHLADLATRNSALFGEVMVARINDGRPLHDDRAPLLTQPGETAYATFAVALMKVVVDRELRGGSRAFGWSLSVRLIGRHSPASNTVRFRRPVINSRNSTSRSPQGHRLIPAKLAVSQYQYNCAVLYLSIWLHRRTPWQGQASHSGCCSVCFA
ncbi:MAG: hypothetical protein QOC62_5281 [Mycobacterium sp.]|nr:hypothetical protein [Mycobacterium sp.]